MTAISLPRSSRGFSLIELLFTIAIGSALVSFTFGPLSPFRATSLTTGGNHVVELLASARQNSIARQAYTAMVVKVRETGRLSWFCLLELSYNDDGSFTDWKIITPWRTLPEGVRFDPKPETDNFLTESAGVPKDLPATMRFHGTDVDLTEQVVVQTYQPDGTLAGGKLLRVRLVEGYDQPGGEGIVYTRPVKPSGSEPANYYDIVILRDTGQLKVERL